MSDSIASQPSIFEKTILFLETLWTLLLFYIFYIIARLLPDSPELKVILNAIYEKNQLNNQRFENQVNKAADILFELVDIKFKLLPKLRGYILEELGLQDTDKVQLESFQACIIKKLAETPTLEALEGVLSQIGRRLNNSDIKNGGYTSKLHPLKIYKIREVKECHLDLYNKLTNDLTPITVIKLCMALNKNLSITSVDASFNHLGNISAIAFSKTNGLKFLNLNTSRISNVGAVYLANNTAFKALDLSKNLIGNTGTLALAKNKYLIKIAVHSNKVNADFAARVFSSHTSLKSLCLGDKSLSDDGAVALAGNTTLKSLVLKNNRIGNFGYKALAANTTLRSLKGCEHLSRNTEHLNAFLNNNTLIHCDVWEVDFDPLITSKDFSSRNKAFLKNQLNFQVFSSMLETNQLPCDLLYFIGSFLISDSTFLKKIMESAKLRVLRKNTLASEAGIFSIKQQQSISKIVSDNETELEYKALFYS